MRQLSQARCGDVVRRSDRLTCIGSPDNVAEPSVLAAVLLAAYNINVPRANVWLGADQQVVGGTLYRFAPTIDQEPPLGAECG